MSITGRSIYEFSSCRGSEDEILFNPGCEFIVCKKEIIQGKTHIYIREIRTGFNKNTVLWVDDNIFSDLSSDTGSHWFSYNRKFVETVYKQGFEKNVNIILKNRTDIAMAYLESEIFLQAIN
jgi:hypothetical protein